jgi:hypothetical protein
LLNIASNHLAASTLCCFDQIGSVQALRGHWNGQAAACRIVRDLHLVIIDVLVMLAPASS